MYVRFLGTNLFFNQIYKTLQTMMNANSLKTICLLIALALFQACCPEEIAPNQPINMTTKIVGSYVGTFQDHPFPDKTNYLVTIAKSTESTDLILITTADGDRFWGTMADEYSFIIRDYPYGSGSLSETGALGFNTSNESFLGQKQ
jgi:hypothetical protein